MNAFALAADGAGSVPGWLVLAAAVIAAVAVFVLFLRAQSLRLPILVLVLIGLLVIAYAVVLLAQRDSERQALQEESQAISARATALDGALAASGLACIDAFTEMAANCEEIVFAKPESVAAARALVRARLMLLRDAGDLLRRAPSADLAALIETWRQPLARDPFGLVAVVLREDFTCGDGHCAVAGLLGEGSQIPAHLANRRFETLYESHAARWKGGAPAGDLPVPPPPLAGAVETPAPAAPSPVPVVPAPVEPERPAPPLSGQGPTPATGGEAPMPAAGAPLPPERPVIPRPARPQAVAPAPAPPPAAAEPAGDPAGAAQ